MSVSLKESITFFHLCCPTRVFERSTHCLWRKWSRLDCKKSIALVAGGEPTTEEYVSRNKVAIIRDTLIYIQDNLHSS